MCGGWLPFTLVAAELSIAYCGWQGRTAGNGPKRKIRTSAMQTVVRSPAFRVPRVRLSRSHAPQHFARVDANHSVGRPFQVVYNGSEEPSYVRVAMLRARSCPAWERLSSKLCFAESLSDLPFVGNATAGLGEIRRHVDTRIGCGPAVYGPGRQYVEFG